MVRFRLLPLVLVGGLSALLAGSAGADPFDAVNAARQRGCGATAGTLARAPALDAAARYIAEGKNLRTAVEASGYRAVNSTLLYLEGARDENELAQLVAKSCPQITQRGLRDAGAYQRGTTLWLVLAEPFTVPALDRAAVAPRVLELVNRARAQPRRCGRDDFGAAPALRWSQPLERVASAHARDMAQRGSMSHTGSDGSAPAQRVTRAGYAWLAVGENIAAGQPDPESVVKGWLASPGHCANLMSPEYTEVGVAFATNPASEAGIYWTQVLAAPASATRRR